MRDESRAPIRKNLTGDNGGNGDFLFRLCYLCLLLACRLRIQVRALPSGEVAIQFRHVLEYGNAGQ